MIHLKSIVREYEKNLIMNALDKTKWNMNRAAKELGTNRTTLVMKCRRLGLMRPRQDTVS